MAGRRTKPIPRETWPEFYAAMWQLAASGGYTYEGEAYGVHPDARLDLYLTAKRHGLCVLLATFCALRFSELARLNCRDIDRNSVYVTRSKGSLSDWHQVSTRLVELHRAWHRAWCDNRQITSDLAFPNRNGRPLSVKVFNDSIGRVLRPFHLSITSHVFRSTCCVMALEQSQQMATVQRALGHRNMSTTDTYVAKMQATEFRLEIPE